MGLGLGFELIVQIRSLRYSYLHCMDIYSPWSLPLSFAAAPQRICFRLVGGSSALAGAGGHSFKSGSSAHPQSSEPEKALSNALSNKIMNPVEVHSPFYCKGTPNLCKPLQLDPYRKDNTHHNFTFLESFCRRGIETTL